jgi:hypothetical protein
MTPQTRHIVFADYRIRAIDNDHDVKNACIALMDDDQVSFNDGPTDCADALYHRLYTEGFPIGPRDIRIIDDCVNDYFRINSLDL